MSSSSSFHTPEFTSLVTEPIVLESLTAYITSSVAELVILDEPAVSSAPGLNTGAQTEPVAQVPGNQTATPNVGGADPTEAHGITPDGFDLQVFGAYRRNNVDKEEPATVPNLAGDLPRTGHNQVHKIYDNMPNGAIEATYLHYGLRIPSCDGLSPREAKKFKLRELKAYHRPSARDISLIEFHRRNIRQMQLNSHHFKREEAIKVPTFLHPIGFDIPNTVPGLERLSIEQKRELLTACYYPWAEDDLDWKLMVYILFAFNLRHHAFKS